MVEGQAHSFRGQPSDHQERRNGNSSANLAEAGLLPDADVGPVTHTQSTFEPVLGSEEAAALLHIHPKTLQRLARNGEIPGFRIGKLWGFRASALNQWLENRLAIRVRSSTCAGISDKLC